MYDALVKRFLSRALPTLVVAVVAVGSVGCARRLQVEPIATAASPPGTVAVHLTVRNEGRGVGDLTEGDFEVYENGTLVDAESSRLRLLDRDVGVVRHTVLLVDLNDADEPEKVEEIARAVSITAQRIARTQPVTVYGFAGEDELATLAHYSPGGGDTGGLSLDGYSAATGKPRDAYGPILKGFEQLRAKTPTGGALLVGTIVVFLSGPDKAKRVDPVRLDIAFSRFKHRVIAIGVGDWKEQPTLQQVGRDGAHRAVRYADLLAAFAKASEDIEADYRGSYLLAYCSPATSGLRTLEVKVTASIEGREVRGALSTEFDASGLSGRCDTEVAPVFAKDATSSPPPAASKKKGDGTQAASREDVPAPATTDDGFVP